MEEKKMVNNKRKSNETNDENPNPSKIYHIDGDVLLGLSLPSSSFIDNHNNNAMTTTPPPPLQPPLLLTGGGSTSRGRGRRGSSNGRRGTSNSEGGRACRAIIKTNPITPPFPWATTHRATVHTMEYLVSQGINTITGEVQCKKCEKAFEIGFDLKEKFQELVRFIIYEEDMRHRAPSKWTDPNLPSCKYCGQYNICKPILAEKKRNINWLFLLLGQLLGCCTLEQLKYFCKHTNNHRTGAKDRVLFLAYYTLGKQLNPNGPFNF